MFPDFGKFRFPFRVEIVVEWPASLEHDGTEYFKTGKVGTNVKSRLPAAEYERDGDLVWLLADGSVVDERYRSIA